MAGLMEKDLRLTFCRKQTLLMFVCMALIMGLSMNRSFLIGYLTMLATIVAIGTISYDEFDNGYAFLMTLPVDRKTYVREKYLFCFLMAAAAWCAGIVLCAAGALLRHDGGSLISELPMLLAVLPVMALPASFLIPLQLKYGAEKSRIVLLVIFGIIAVILMGTKHFGEGTQNPFASLAKAAESLSPVTVLLVLTAVCALCSYACYRWGVTVMEKKEF